MDARLFTVERFRHGSSAPKRYVPRNFVFLTQYKAPFMPFSPTNPPELVIFDNDGVLIDSEILAGDANAEALASFGISMNAEEAMHRFIGLGPAGMKESLLALGVADLASYQRKVWQAMGDKIATQLTAIDGAIDLIAKLKAAGIPVCVCSNADENWLLTTHRQVGLSAVLNPLHYFHRDLVEHGKPAPDMHLLALDTFGVAADRALVIEDTMVGAEGAISAGIEVWGFTGASGVPENRTKALMSLGCQKVLASHQEIGELITN